MKHFRFACLAGASALVWTCAADAARPRYGGTLRIETAAAMRTFNPAAPPADPADALARRWLHPLVFETLLTVDGRRGLVPGLAVHWAANADFTRWQFQLRSGVRLHDGSPLDAERVATVLRNVHREWTVAAQPGSVSIETSVAAPDLAWRLASNRYAVAFARPGGGEPIGSGPFAIDRWEPRRMRLRAHDEHWGGRGFLDAIQVEMSRTMADQLSSLEAGRADLISLQPQEVRRVSQRGFRVIASGPIELLALRFEGRALAPALKSLRRATSLAIDRLSMCNVLLQRQAQPAPALLPDWLTGYAALLGSSPDRREARRLTGTVPPTQRTLTLGFDESDAVVRAVAERIAVDGREAGISVALGSAAAPTLKPDVRLVRVRLEIATNEQALAAAVAILDPQGRLWPQAQRPRAGAPMEDLYRFERDLLEQASVVPLVHLSELYAAAPALESWNEPMVRPSGAWNLANVWLRPVAR